jgi:hypothetical protein
MCAAPWACSVSFPLIVEALLIATAGRTEALEEFDGPGTAALEERIGNPWKIVQDLNDYPAP